MRKLIIISALVIFGLSAKVSAQFTNLLTFDDTNGTFPYYSSLVLQGNVLYGMTEDGGFYEMAPCFQLNRWQ